jgi:hypothetical protein
MSYHYGMGTNGDVAIARVTGCPPDRGTINLGPPTDRLSDERRQVVQQHYQGQNCVRHPDMPNAWCCDGFVRDPSGGVSVRLSELPGWVPYALIGGVGLIVLLAVATPAISGAAGAYMTAPEGKKRHAAWRGAALGLGSSFAAGALLHGTGMQHLAGAAPFAAGAYYGSQLADEERA